MRFNKFDAEFKRAVLDTKSAESRKAMRKRAKIEIAKQHYLRMGYEPQEALDKAYHEVNNNL